MLPSMTSSPTRTTRPPRTDGSIAVRTLIGRPYRSVSAAASRLLLGAGQLDRREHPRDRAVAAGGGEFEQVVDRPAVERALALAGDGVLEQRLGDRLHLVADHVVEQRDAALGVGRRRRRAAVARLDSASRMRSKRNSSSSTSSSAPSCSAAANSAVVGRRLERVEQIPRRRPAQRRPRRARAAAELAPILPSNRPPASSARPSAGVRRVGERAAQPRLGDEQVDDRVQLLGEAGEALAGGEPGGHGVETLAQLGERLAAGGLHHDWLPAACLSLVLGVEAGEERVDGRADLGVVGQPLVDDLLRQLDRQGADLGRAARARSRCAGWPAAPRRGR